MRHRFILVLTLLASCSPTTSTTDKKTAEQRVAAAPRSLPATSPEASAAKQVAEQYFAHIKRKQFAVARQLWDNDGAASGGDAAALAASFDRFTRYEPSVGAPTAITIRDGMQYIAVGAKAKVTDTLRNGRTYMREGAILLRRRDTKAGAPAPWRIWGVDLREPH